MSKIAKRILARWRRRGAGVWRVTLVVDGHDDEFVYLQPGHISRTLAVATSRVACAKELGEELNNIILQQAQREG